ncbi:MAG: hypothetical protein HOI14_06685 [Flavobacteriaceae bacterium]|jgi:hypothetical protein|nr:hypothetical protein [Flavobacteriaceae bacterium]
MKKVFLIILSIILHSCGIVNDTTEETFTYTFKLKNETGVTLEIKGGLDRLSSLVNNGNSFECSYESPNGVDVGLCGQFIQIKIPNSNNGYRCHGAISDVENLCFIEDERLFTRLDGTVFTEIDTRVYEYVLTPDILDNVFVLPD